MMAEKKTVAVVAVLVFGVSAVYAGAEILATQVDVPKKPLWVCDAYPGLASGSLAYARPTDLPSGVILRAAGLTIEDKDVADEIAKAPAQIQDQLRKNAFFLLENLTTRRLLVVAAKAQMVQQKNSPPSDEQELTQAYLKGLVADVDANDTEVARFYEENKEACGGATLDQVESQIRQIVLQEKQQALIDEHVRTMGRRMPIDVSASWTKQQSVLARDNPVDKARASGKPSLVDFGSTGCRPCDMLAPILDALNEKYEGKLNVLFIHVGQEQILAARYGVQTIPMQFFYDKNGKEVFRHTGFWPQVEIEKKLAEMGVSQ